MEGSLEKTTFNQGRASGGSQVKNGSGESVAEESCFIFKKWYLQREEKEWNTQKVASINCKRVEVKKRYTVKTYRKYKYGLKCQIVL